MQIISMAWTTAAFRARAKSVTRRAWAVEYALRLREGQRLQVFDRSPRVHGKWIGLIVLTGRPYLQEMAVAPDSDYDAEGFRFYEEHPELLSAGAPWRSISWDTWLTWKRTGGKLWVVRFETVEVDEPLVPAGRQERLAI
jgi:hypothetical protein